MESNTINEIHLKSIDRISSEFNRLFIVWLSVLLCFSLLFFYRFPLNSTKQPLHKHDACVCFYFTAWLVFVRNQNSATIICFCCCCLLFHLFFLVWIVLLWICHTKEKVIRTINVQYTCESRFFSFLFLLVNKVTDVIE